MTRPRYSADVDLKLIVNDREISLAQVGPKHAIVVDPIDLPATDGEIRIIINGEVSTTHPVILYEGISTQSKRFNFW